MLYAFVLVSEKERTFFAFLPLDIRVPNLGALFFRCLFLQYSFRANGEYVHEYFEYAAGLLLKEALIN